MRSELVRASRRRTSHRTLFVSLLLLVLTGLVAGQTAPAPQQKQAAQGAMQPAWSPDGKWIAFVKAEASGNSLRLVSAENSQQIVLWKATGFVGMPAWSPKGDRIAFASGGKIRIIPASGGEPIVIAQPAGPSDSPAWSPDGDRIAYESSVPGGRYDDLHIYVTSLSRRTAEAVITNKGRNAMPAWSRNGCCLFYVHSVGMSFSQIHRFDLRTQTSQQITNVTDTHYQPTPSPNGRFLAFATTRRLYLLDLRSQRRRSLNCTDDWSSRPSWSPDGKSVALEVGAGHHKIITCEIATRKIKTLAK